MIFTQQRYSYLFNHKILSTPNYTLEKTPNVWYNRCKKLQLWKFTLKTVQKNVNLHICEKLTVPYC